MRTLTRLLLLGLVGSLHAAEVYRVDGADGIPVFSDEPSEGAVTVPLPETSRYTPRDYTLPEAALVTPGSAGEPRDLAGTAASAPAIRSPVAGEAGDGAGASGVPPRQPDAVAAPVHYGLITLSRPRPDESLWQPQGRVQVEVQLVPGLAEGAGHRLQLLLDGQLIDLGEATRHTLNDLPHGSHQLRARVVDADGRVQIDSPPVAFFVQRPFPRP